MVRAPDSIVRSVVPVLCHSASIALHVVVLGGAALSTPSLSFAQNKPVAPVLYAMSLESEPEEAASAAVTQKWLAPFPAPSHEPQGVSDPPIVEKWLAPSEPTVVPPVEGLAYSEYDMPYRGPLGQDLRSFEIGSCPSGFFVDVQFGAGGGPRHLDYTEGGPPAKPRARREPAGQRPANAPHAWSCPKSLRDRFLVLCRKTYLPKQP